jgi:mannose-1-phosphate guanylyltransferase
MQALILAGGEGTRLRPLTETVPKTVLPLAGRPFAAYAIDWLERHGADQVILSCGYLAEGMREALVGATGPALTFAAEPEPRGTAGAIKFCESMLGERFLVLNGDVLADLDLSALIAQHENTGARATIALYPVDDPSAYGLVRRSSDGKITEFLEKPDADQIDTDEINAGAYLLERSVLDLIPPDRAVSIERETFQELVGNGLYGRRLEGYWLDIGTPERFRQASWDILERRVETVVGDRIGPDGTLVADGAEVDPAATVKPPALIASGARVEAGATVGPRAVVGRGCEIGEGAVVEGTVLFADCVVGAGVRLDGAILSARAEVAPGAEPPSGTVAGEGELVGRGPGGSARPP